MLHQHPTHAAAAHIRIDKQRIHMLPTQLFEKIGRRMCLTREGKKLLPHIYELTRVMDTLREAAKKESDPDGEATHVDGLP